jgi:methionyl-tRNA formyltransferase
MRLVLGADAARLKAVFTYRVEPPQEKYLDQIRRLGEERDVPVYETQAVGREQYRELWAELRPDFILAVKWRTMVPGWVIDSARRGLIIFHASLLPKYRGFAPINWPLINGEERTGVTMFYAADEVDAGDIIDQREIPITDADDAATLDEKVAATVELMLAENLPRLASNTAPRVPQDHEQATFAIWRSEADGAMDWNLPARRLFNLVRALTSPYAGAFTRLDGRRLTVWSAEVEKEPRVYVGSIPGKVERILPGVGVNVLTGDGILRLKDVQLEGDRRRNAAEVIRLLKTRLG